MANGHHLDLEGIWRLPSGQSVRFLQMDGSTQTAVYWFQTKDMVTPNQSARILSGIAAPRKTWLMVSLLFNTSVNQRQAEKFLEHIQVNLSAQLKRSLPATQ